MEYFYRFMRVKTGLLMIDGKPEGDTWNYDHENRGFDQVHTPVIRKTLPESSHLIEAREFYEYSGAFLFPTSRTQALSVFDDFITHHLADFGRLEDASYQEDDLMHHSLISTALNMGLLSPLEVATRVAESDAPIAAREGFVRQIIGWREFVHQFFEFYEGDIHTVNYFKQSAPLPLYFWGSRYREVGTETLSTHTNLSCVDRVIERVDRLGYSHHIERLMVVGNFSLLTDRDPHSVNQWFWEQYADAYEWVVTPNVIAMSQFADAGRLASKPYIASANYINKMSDSCKSCRYDPKEKYGENACPLNYLYWAFVDSNRDEFIRGRQPFILNQLPKLDLEKLHQQKAHFLARVGGSGTLP
jgi:deoxyribodipyrimidine photolyase-related protein